MARHKTGEKSPKSDQYDFDGYVDNVQRPQPTPEDRRIVLTADERFPPIRSTNAGCWWKSKT
jgi:hypothetical protein